MRLRLLFLPGLTLILGTATALAGDWKGWRGPTGNGIAAEEGPAPPVRWSETENVVWKTPIPGRGHSSPLLLGDLVVLTTADEAQQIQSVVAFDRETGAQRWKRAVHTGGFVQKIHPKNSQATPSPCSDGERIFVVFHNAGQIHLTALSKDGAVRWTKDTGPYLCRYGYGYAPSPVIAGPNVIVSSEFEKDGYLAAFDRESGEERWRVPRNGTTSYSTPALAEVAGRRQIVTSGNRRLTAYDPENGKTLWEVEAITLATCGTPVWEGDLVFASGGFPNKETAAVRADGSGEIVWKNQVKCYEQSLLVFEGHVYAIDDSGVAHCWRASDGEERWKSRLGGPVSASPVMAGGMIYFFDEKGGAQVVRANPEAFELVGQSTLGSEVFASPAISGGRIFLRVAERDGDQRQEWLYCLGAK
ncbi:MAG: PQQ-binding-like beta-propeller repeat protein [Verrucomicrobiae bacterium]|nr:PQQ-binding-like beta-propeller repeat protein [Verrucomicrobiae bacterium]